MKYGAGPTTAVQVDYLYGYSFTHNVYQVGIIILAQNAQLRWALSTQANSPLP